MFWDYVVLVTAYVCEYSKGIDLYTLSRWLLLHVKCSLIKRGWGKEAAKVNFGAMHRAVKARCCPACIS